MVERIADETPKADKRENPFPSVDQIDISAAIRNATAFAAKEQAERRTGPAFVTRGPEFCRRTGS